MKVTGTTALFILLLLSSGSMYAGPILGSANSFAVLAGSAVTNTGPTNITGNVGAGAATSGFSTGSTTTGTTYVGDSIEAQAVADTSAALTYLSGLTPTGDLTGIDLGGLLLTAGIYNFSSSAQLTGNLVLDFQGISDGMFVFQTGSTLITSAESKVDVINSGTNDRVYWVVGSSATLGTGSSFMGNLIADQSITLNTGASIRNGAALAVGGAVTLDSNTLGIPQQGATLSPAPEPDSIVLLGSGLLAMAIPVRRRLCALKAFQA